MKKTTLLLFILIPFSYTILSQNTIIFKVKYKPETKYNQTIEQSSQNEINYSGSDEILQRLKDKGIQNPTITNTQSIMKTIFKTGKISSDSISPLTLEFLSSKSSDEKKAIPDGTLIYGRGTSENMPMLDSIVSDKLNTEFKTAILQTMQSTFSQLSFPEKKVKVGKSFSRDIPLSIPIAGRTLDMTITANYKLLSIENGISYFDISETYKIKTTITKYTVKATGNGTGTLSYDIANNYYLKYQLNSEMDMKMKLDNFDMALKTKNGLIQTTEISKN